LSNALDSLRIVDLRGLVLHEAHDEARLRRLWRLIEEEGVQRNPVIVAPLPGRSLEISPGGERFFVLDGAHRVHALRALGCRHALVQCVALPERAEGWGHVLDGGGLEGRLREVAGVEILAEAFDVSGEDRLVAEVRLPDGAGLSVRACGGEGIGAVVRGMWALRAAYPEGGRSRRVKPGEPAGPGEAVVSYRRFTPGELVSVVEGGRVLPAGVTRFVVGERVLNVRLPLGMLRDGTLPERNAELADFVRAAREADRVRQYVEPVVLFE